MELKPCPFCGGEVDIEGASCNYGKKTILVDILCLECGAKVKLKTAWETIPMHEAIEAWNRRADND